MVIILMVCLFGCMFGGMRDGAHTLVFLCLGLCPVMFSRFRGGCDGLGVA